MEPKFVKLWKLLQDGEKCSSGRKELLILRRNEMSSQFLSDIGATNLSSASRTVPVIQPLLERITKEKEQERESLHALISSNLPDFSQQCQDAVSLTLRLGSVRSHVEHNEREVERHSSQVVKVTSAHSNLKQELDKYTTLWTALSLLKGYQDALKAVTGLVDQGNFKAAIEALPDEIQAEEWIRDLPQWKQLDLQRNETVALLKDRIRTALDECVHWLEASKLRLRVVTEGARTKNC